MSTLAHSRTHARRPRPARVRVCLPQAFLRQHSPEAARADGDAAKMPAQVRLAASCANLRS
eukprot:639216-Pleurochrysis_carterae.AAC.1